MTESKSDADAATGRGGAARKYMSVGSARLRNAAAAVETYERVRDWASNAELRGLTDSETKVTWLFGSHLPGYDEIAREVSDFVGNHLGDLIADARERLAERALTACGVALGDGAPSASTTDDSRAPGITPNTTEPTDDT
jgi:hypothetical protein